MRHAGRPLSCGRRVTCKAGRGREKFKGPQPTGEDCRKVTNYGYVHWYMATSGTGNRLPSSINRAPDGDLPSISKEFCSPTFPVCYHDPGFGEAPLKGQPGQRPLSPAALPRVGRSGPPPLPSSFFPRSASAATPSCPAWVGSYCTTTTCPSLPHGRPRVRGAHQDARAGRRRLLLPCAAREGATKAGAATHCRPCPAALADLSHFTSCCFHWRPRRSRALTPSSRRTSASTTSACT